MDYVMMTAPVHLYSGCRLKHSKIGLVRFSQYLTMLAGPLDPLGRKPGLYRDHTRVMVSDGNGEIEVLASNLLLVDTYPRPTEAEIPNNFSLEERLGDLPCLIKFWPGDIVRVPGSKREGFWVVNRVTFDDMSGRPIYELTDPRGQCIEWNPWQKICDDPSITVDRGNVYWLYHDSSKLSFKSDQEELTFWAREGISVPGLGKDMSPGQTMWPCAQSFDDGSADLITRNQKYPSSFHTYKLHEIFAMQNRERVRALTERCFAQELVEARTMKA